MVGNIIQIKSGITINNDVSAKIRENNMCMRKVIFRITVYVTVKKINVQEILLVTRNYTR